MNTIKRLALINKVNVDLGSQFPLKHVPITMDDIEKVYNRCVLGFSVDAKTKKGLGKGYLTGILYLAPASLSGVNMCPKSSAGCRAACLFTAGRGRFYSVTRARIVKTLAMVFDQLRFDKNVKKSIKSGIVKARNKGLTLCIRLNGTSDRLWELNSDIIQSFPDVIFYDYTAIPKRYNFKIPANYHLTFSLKEDNDSDAIHVLNKGGSVAAVFRTSELPVSLFGYTVVNGDATDLRFLDAKGVVVGLKAKGRAKKDTSGFVRDTVPIVSGLTQDDMAAAYKWHPELFN
jgi:hypothetical protein